jgi:Cu-Zn family superoxide dismutase
MKYKVLIIFLILCIAGLAHAESLVVKVNLISEKGIGEEIGTITISSSPYGLILIPDLKNLSPGLHGFHVHQNPDCGPGEQDGKKIPGLAAGGHYDPMKTEKHNGPYGDGHLGDLPALYVDQEGNATLPLLAPRLKISDLRGRSLMIHV